ncbi:DNA methyltransferase [Streptomyces albidoflavus]
MAEKPIAWNEIRERAVRFSREWRGESRENAEAQTFWNEWFEIFGIRRRRYVQFERKAMRKSTGGRGRIDAFWEGQVAVEHKSSGRSLVEAESQALDYLDSLENVAQPRLVITSDFANFRVLDLEGNSVTEFPLDSLPDHIELFGFIAGYESRSYKPADEVNVHAAELMGQLYDSLTETGYTGHDLKVFLVRCMFIFFADDTGIWEKGLFDEFLEVRTAEDGSDTGPLMEHLFRVLDTPEDRRTNTLEKTLSRFPYVNGQLFSERIQIPDFNTELRALLIKCASFDWTAVSPAIFGAMFQSVMDAEARRSLGAHYTSEQNILKVIEPLFLDELRSEFQAARTSVRRLEELRARLRRLTFFDPAAGCGNFLVVAYRELRDLEFDILVRLEELRGTGQLHVSIDQLSGLSQVDVDQFYAIEVEEFPARIAETALYLVDHLANMRLSKHFGQYFARIPLRAQANVRVGNALQIAWDDFLPAEKCTYVLGNPPFIGKQHRTSSQREDMDRVFAGKSGTGVLDYVTAWFRRAAEYVRGHDTRVAFVATNSIVQGEQVPALWPDLLSRGIVIDFAHRTFNWSSEGRGSAHVHVVVIGFSCGGKRPKKTLFDHPAGGEEVRALDVSNINPYLVNAPTVVAVRRSYPLAPSVPLARFGSMPNDGKHLILDEDERSDVMRNDAVAAKYVRELVGAAEMLKGEHRYCLWLERADPADVRTSEFLASRVDEVRKYRNSSTRSATRALANYPTLFGEIRQPEESYLCLPRHSSQIRRYIPMAYYEPLDIAHDSTLTIAGTDEYVFGVLASDMFMVWVRTVAGRIKSDFRLSVDLVYNTFPWPEVTGAKESKVRELAQEVLDARAAYPNATLADLYHPSSMPAEVARAHAALDRAVERLYTRRKLSSELERQQVLFDRYEQLVGTLPDHPEKRKRGRKPTARA